MILGFLTVKFTLVIISDKKFSWVKLRDGKLDYQFLQCLFDILQAISTKQYFELKESKKYV